MVGEDCWFGKQGDLAYADNVVTTLLDSHFTQKLVESFEPDTRQLIFMSVPSTSGQNLIPRLLASRLADLFSRLADLYSADACDGGLFYTIHEDREIKTFPPGEGVLSGRKYTARVNMDFLANKSVIVVDDTVSSGASVSSFIRSLHADGIHVRGAVALFGDMQLVPDRAEQEAFESFVNRVCHREDTGVVHSMVSRLEMKSLVGLVDTYGKDLLGKAVDKFLRDVQCVKMEDELPSLFKGHSTTELLDLWYRMHTHETDGSENAMAGIMNDFLMEYRLCPVSWRLGRDYEDDRARADRMVANLRGRELYPGL